MNARRRVALFLPQMWEEVYSRISYRLDDEHLEIAQYPLNVERTGLLGDAYGSARERSKQGEVPVLLLPVAHCADNIDQQGLSIIGPAIKTRDDVYVFRGRKRPKGKAIFRIAVREEELTTSNISRVVLHHWCPDTYFFSLCDEPNHTHSHFEPRFRHLPVASPRRRLDAVANGQYEAAIFMGRELDEVRPFEHPDVLDAANLNRLVCNRYNCKLFPRAVFATFQDVASQPHNTEIITEFVNALNEIVPLINASPKQPEGRTGRSQFLCYTGRNSEQADVDTILAFTHDMRHELLAYDRLSELPDNMRSLRPADFLWWSEIAYTKIMGLLIDAATNTSVTEIFRLYDVTPSAGELTEKQDQVRFFCEELRSRLARDNAAFRFEDAINLIEKIRRLDGDEKVGLEFFLKETWARLNRESAAA